MGQILIRNIDDHVHQKLKAKAAARGQSLEAYLRALLSETAGPTKAEILAEAEAIQAQSAPVSIAAEDLIREMRDERDAQLMVPIRLKDPS